MSDRITYVLVTVLCIIGMAQTAPAVAGNVDLPRFPSLSPDGQEIVFSWRGALWKTSIDGGHAVRLTNHPADDLRSAWSPDGSRIAFNSNRDGYSNIWIMNADGTNLRQVTDIDRSCNISGFSLDHDGNEVITFEALLEADVYRSFRPYMVSPMGGDLMRMHDAYGSHPVLSPDGMRIAFTRGGYYYGWSRRHYRGSESQDVWVYDIEADSYTQLTDWEGNAGKARWGGPTGRTLLYLSDRELNTVNLWQMSAHEGEATSARITSFDGRDVQTFDVSADGSTVVLMVWDTLYHLDMGDLERGPQPVSITAIEDDGDNYELKSINREISEAALSPDGQVMASVAYGRVYIRNVDDNSPTRQVTHSHARHKDLAWSPDGLKLYFTNDEDGTESIYAATVAMTRSEVRKQFEQALNDVDDTPASDDSNDHNDADEHIGGPRVDDDEDENDNGDDEDDTNDEADEDIEPALDPKRWHDALTFNIERVVATEHNDRNASPSPDGTKLAFRRSRGDVMMLDLETSQASQLVESWDHVIHWQWSPDGRHLAYSMNNLNYSSDIYIVAADGSEEPVNVTRHPKNDVNPTWSADGRILAFRSNRVNNEYDVWMVYLDRELESLTARELDKYYEDAVRAAKRRKPLSPKRDKDDDKKDDDKKGTEPVNWHLDDAYLRLKRMTRIPGSVGDVNITPGGDRLIFSATVDGSRSIYSIKWDGSDRNQITGNVNVQHLTLDGEKIVFVTSGRAGTINTSGRGGRDYVDLSDRLRIDLQKQNSQKFLEAARTLGEMFYHHNMKGLDWPTITSEYHALARQARTADEFNHVGNRFLGELDGSHLGIRASSPGSPIREALGRLGTIHHRVTLDDGYGFEITHIVPDGPAETGPMKLQVGDIITAIDRQTFDRYDTVESFLKGRIGNETIITIMRQRERGDTVELHALITPISYGAEASLKYEAWVKHNRDLVSEWSDGRIGYIHIQGMNQPSLDVYERDLYAAAGHKDGLLIDVRNNGGGWTADRLLASIMVQEHAYTIPRGAPLDAVGHYPQDRLFIQRYTLPINMLCNEKSFSNAEIISHAFKTLGRGTLVGQTTYGGVISTGGFSLIDGTFVRMPFRGWYLPDGTDMEDQGAVPDIIVDQTPEAEAANDDAQLRAAVEDLLSHLGDE
jgi:tricorn protease